MGFYEVYLSQEVSRLYRKSRSWPIKRARRVYSAGMKLDDFLGWVEIEQEMLYPISPLTQNILMRMSKNFINALVLAGEPLESISSDLRQKAVGGMPIVLSVAASYLNYRPVSLWPLEITNRALTLGYELCMRMDRYPEESGKVQTLSRRFLDCLYAAKGEKFTPPPFLLVLAK